LLSWRDKKSNEPDTNANNRLDDIKDKVKRMEKAPTLKVNPETFRVKDIQSATTKRKIRMKRGAWYRIPKDAGKDTE
jgi:hypothetical protein